MSRVVIEQDPTDPEAKVWRIEGERAERFAVRYDAGLAFVDKGAHEWCDGCHKNAHKTRKQALACIEKVARGKAADWTSIAKSARAERLAK